jgi:hypothetical protein
MKILTLRSIRRQLLPWFLIACALLSLIPAHLTLAADPNRLRIALRQGTNQMNIGASFTVDIQAYGDAAPATSAYGNLTYPSNMVRVDRISLDGSAYGAPAVKDLKNGLIEFSASGGTGTSGFAKIFAVTFVATGAGTNAINFSGDSRVNNSATAYTELKFTVTNPAPTTPTTPKPSTSVKPSVAPVPIPSTTPLPTPTPTPSPEDTPQITPDPGGVVNNVTVTPSYTSATISWKVNAAQPKSTFQYGNQSSSLDQKADVTLSQSGEFTATVSALTPGKRYYFAIDGSGSDGKNGTYSGTIITSGFPVTITVTENNQPAKNAQVKIGTTTRTASSNGKLSIGLAAGTYNATITTATASLSVTNLVVEAKSIPANGAAPAVQTYTYNLNSSPLEQGPGASTSILTFVGILIAGTVFLGFGFVGFMAYRRRKFEAGGTAGTSSGTTVIIDDGYDWKQDNTLSSPSLPPPPPSSDSQPTNSVHIDDEEPVDIFDRPK